MSKPTPPTYSTTNWRSYNSALKLRASLLIWFDPETDGHAAPSGNRGRSATFTDAAIQSCLTLKALFGLSLRQATGPVASLLELAELDWPVPDFSTISRHQKGLNVAIPFVLLYNLQPPQSAQSSKTPLQAMKDWHRLKLELLSNQPYYLLGCDN